MLTLAGGLRKSNGIIRYDPLIPQTANPVCADIAAYQKDILNLLQYEEAFRKLSFKGLKGVNWYTPEFRLRFQEAQANAESNNEAILRDLLVIPRNIVNYDAIYQTVSSQILNCINVLKHSYNQDVQDLLLQNLETLLEIVAGKKSGEGILGNAEQVCQKIKGYCYVMQKDDTFIEETYQKVVRDYQDDKQAVPQLQAEINRLQARIKELNAQYMAEVISAGVTGGVALFSILFGPWGWIFGICCVAASIGTGVAAVLADRQIKEATKQLNAKSALFGVRQNDLPILEALNTSCKQLTDAGGAALESLKNILELWKELRDAIIQMITILREGPGEARNHMYIMLEKNIKESDEEWKGIVEFAQKLQGVDVKFPGKIYPFTA